MNEKIYRLRCIGGFRDGMVYPEAIKSGRVVDVPESTYRKMLGSGGVFEELGWFPPPPTKAEPTWEDAAKLVEEAKLQGREGLCKAEKANGDLCSLKAQDNDYCHIHNRSR